MVINNIKNVLTIMLTFLSLILFSQNNMNEQLSRLFLDLDLTSSPKAMALKSSLKFEHGINRGISWGKTGENFSTYIAEFNNNSLIESRIKEGQITIIQKDEEVQSGTFSINERIGFYSYEDMIKEYYKISSSFEKLGYKIKSSIVENYNFETKTEHTEILIENNSKKSTLTIGYTLPPEDETDKEYFLAIIYTNH